MSKLDSVILAHEKDVPLLQGDDLMKTCSRAANEGFRCQKHSTVKTAVTRGMPRGVYPSNAKAGLGIALNRFVTFHPHIKAFPLSNSPSYRAVVHYHGHPTAQ